MNKKIIWVFAGVIILLLCFCSRLVPAKNADTGIYISVAERLLYGDRLYIDVYDNKDPLFYYLVAATRLAGPLAGYFFELVMIVLSSISVYLIALNVSIPKKASIIGAIATPLITTGVFYNPCDTFIVPVALSLLTCLLFIKKRPFFAGVLIGVLFFTKLIMTPLPFVFCFTYTWIKDVPALRLSNMKFSILGIISVIITFVLFLFMRGELVPYVHTQILNVLYSQGTLVDNSSFLNSVISHFRTMFLSDFRHFSLTLSTILGAIFILIMLKRGRLSIELRAFLCSIIVTLAASIVILAITGIWEHHLQLIYFVNTLMAVYLISCVFDHFHLQPLAVVAIILIPILLSGSIDLRTYFENPFRFPGKLNSLRTLSNETKYLIIETGGMSAGYARIGQNDDEGHAFGLQDYKLICPEFHQYYFYSEERLNNILDCASRAPFLIVSESVTLWNDNGLEWLPPYSDRNRLIETWNSYVNKVEKVLSENFSCKQIDQSGARVCKKINLESDLPSLELYQ